MRLELAARRVIMGQGGEQCDKNEARLIVQAIEHIGVAGYDERTLVERELEIRRTIANKNEPKEVRKSARNDLALVVAVQDIADRVGLSKTEQETSE